MPKLGLSRGLPTNDLAGFLDNPSEMVRAAAVSAFPADARPLTADARAAIVARLEDSSPLVRKAAAVASARHRIAEAVPRLIRLVTGDDPAKDEATLALCSLPDPRAIPTYVDALRGRNPDLRRSAETALLVIRDAARPDLSARLAKGEFLGSSALLIERILARFAPVVAWKTIGPFPRTLGPMFAVSASIDFAHPEAGAEGRVVAWTDRRGDPANGRVVLDDLKADAGGFGYDGRNSPQVSAFAYAELVSVRARTALLLAGSSGSIQVIVNDKPVLNVQDYAGRPYAPGSDLARISLVKGINRILIRSHQGLGTWSFGLQVSEDDGVAIAPTPETSGIEALRAYALGHDGDPGKGEALFFDPRGIGCVKCHAVAARGTVTVGPNLAGLASKYDKAEVIRSVIAPSDRIATGYQPTLIARVDGTVVTGLLRVETDAELELIDAEAQSIRVPKNQLEDRKVSAVSIMPVGQVDPLTPTEFADLIAYLMSLKSQP